MEPVLDDRLQRATDFVRQCRLDVVACFPELDKLTSLCQQVFQVKHVWLAVPGTTHFNLMSTHGFSPAPLLLDDSTINLILQPNQVVFENIHQQTDALPNKVLSQLDSLAFYASCPLLAKSGDVIGALVLLDDNPRTLACHETTVLSQMAALVMDFLYESLEKQHFEQQVKLLELLIDDIPDALVACNERGQLSQFNKVARDWHGVDVLDCPPELLSYYYDLYEADGVTVLPFERIPLIRAFNGEKIDNAEICIKARGTETRRVRCKGQQYCNNKGQVLGALIIMHDITDESRVKRLKDEFISTVSHELRTPITAILGSLSLVVNNVTGELTEQTCKMLKVALNNSQKLKLLVDDLLDMEKLLAGKAEFNLQLSDLHNECLQAIADNQPYADKYGISLCLQSHSSCQLIIDSAKLQQVLSNLLSNAIKHSAPGSKVYLRYTKQDDNIRFEIEDSGIGIPLSLQKNIFQRFFQADSSSTRNAKGTGLGLAICKAIVESAGGHINFRSKPGQGSVFFFDYPIQATENQQPLDGNG